MAGLGKALCLLLVSTWFLCCLTDTLPTDWRTGIATCYGGAQDGKVDLSLDC